MPLKQQATYKAVEDKMMELPEPAYGGLNLKDLEYEQLVSQSPYMLNMMYRNGSFSKRYGQELYKTGTDTVYNMTVYRGSLIRHIGSKIYIDDTEKTSGIATSKGLFVKFNQRLYYFCDNVYECYYDTSEYKLLSEVPSDWTTNYTNYYRYTNGAYVRITDATCPTFTESTFYKSNPNYNTLVWQEVEPYIPTIVINRKPDGTGGDVSDSYNMLGTGFANHFHGDGTSTVFHLTDKNLDSGTSDVPKVIVDNEIWTHDENLSAAKTFKVDYTAGTITLKSAAPSGTNNVEITAYKHDAEWTDYHDQILGSKYYACFGGNNNSRLFLAGGGKSTYYYSAVFDASYFPYTNFARVGNSADDITGFGQQYNVLMVFKPTEIFSLTYYQATSDTTTSESQVGIGMFSSQVVNSSIGCDCPNTIQLINNQLTWFSSKAGVCTLVSTNVVDERNVRPISRNIDRTNNFNVQGVLDINLYGGGTNTLYESVQSIDYDSKYFLVFPKEYQKVNNVWTQVDLGKCYVWDYLISPYTVTSSKVTNPRDLSWFLFDHFFVRQFLRVNDDLIYSSDKTTLQGKLIKLNDTFEDIDFENPTSSNKAIEAYYMTPFLQFDAVEYLKTVKNLYIQCRGDTASNIDIYYYTDESSDPTSDPDSIIIGGKIWTQFDWSTFDWTIVNWGSIFRRKCSLKKIQMASFLFKNDEISRDMSITHISLQYQIVKYVK